MSSSNSFSLGDLYHSLDDTTALDHIDDASSIVAFQNIGSMLFAGDSGVPHFVHTTPDFLMRGGRPVAPTFIEDSQRLPSSRPTTRINDDLVLRMKKPIELPSLNPHPQDLDTHDDIMPSRHFDTQRPSTNMGRLVIHDTLTPRAREFLPRTTQRRPMHAKRPSYPQSYHTRPSVN